MKRISITLVALMILGSSLSAQSFRSLIKKANTQYELNAYNLAIPNYEAALKKDPKDGEALTRLADCYRHLNKMEQAANIYATGLRQKEYDKIHILNFGHTLKAMQRYDEAKQWYLLYARDVDQLVGNHFAQSCDFAKGQMGVNSSYSVANEMVNTSAADFAPTFYGTEQVIYASSRTDILRSSAGWTGKANNQLFLAAINDKQFLASPTFLKGTHISDAYNEGPLTFSPDGRMVVYTKNNFVDGTRQIPSSGLELSMFTADIDDRGNWTNIQPFPYNGTDYSTGYPMFSPDGSALYFSSNRPDGFGGFDIYVSYRTGNTWSAPQNLGPVVNSLGDEISPFFDGEMLYFSSNWHQGLGGYDIFRAEQSSDRWIRIFHLGNQVNTSFDDYGFTYNSFLNLGYLTSNRLGGRGNEDIYKVTRAANYVALRIIDTANGLPVSNAIVDFGNCGDAAYEADSRGMYSFQAVKGLNCDIVIKKTGYLSASASLSALSATNQQEHVISLSKQGEAYTGKVIDYTSNQPVAGTVVTATNQATGSQATTTTDASGNYYLALSPFSSYVLRFSRQAFQDLNVTVKTDDGLNRSILGVVSIFPVGTGGVVDTPDSPYKPNPDAAEETVVQTGYAVQIAANNKPSVAGYDNMEDVGVVYAKEVGSLYKVRVGPFATKEEAKAAQKVARDRGYKGAFVVTEEGVEMKVPNKTTPKGGKEVAPAEETVDIEEGSLGKYKIQLAAYSNTKWFDGSSIEDLGVIEDKKRGKYTIKYLSGFDTLNGAQIALRQVKAAGFDSAYIVEDINGELKKVK